MSNRTDWLDPLNRIEIQRAVFRKSHNVRLRDGRYFSLNYSKAPGKVLIRPTGNKVQTALAPMGYFDIKTLLDPLWLESTN